MKAFNYMTLFTLAVTTVACNETITPKLIDANQSTTVPPVIKPEEYYLRVKNISPANRKFHLHRSGPGNHFTNCEIKTPMSFDSLLYKNPATRSDYDIHCMFEAEELDLEQKGFSFQFEASPNTCEHVGYSAFSFFNFKPGSSSGKYTAVLCETGVVDTDLPADPHLRPQTSDNTQLGCGKMVLDEGAGLGRINSQNASPIDYEEDLQKLCRYDYSTSSKKPGPNCDTGTIEVKVVTYSAVPSEIEGEAPRIVPSITRIPYDCGGQVSACINGPIVQEDGYVDETTLITVYKTEENEPFAEKREYERASRKWGTLFYANFRRNLANPFIKYGAQRESTHVTYASAFEGFSQIYPALQENYSAGRSYNPNYSLPGLSFEDHVRDLSNFVTKKGTSFAAEPFLGGKDEETGDEYRTNPFYTFYCLDAAREIKARIKMSVRDWDRTFDKDRDFGLFDMISDVYMGDDHARIDNPFGVENDNDLDPVNAMNDYPDWDDLVRMQRDSDDFNAIFTWWRPVRGFNHQSLFPQIIE